MHNLMGVVHDTLSPEGSCKRSGIFHNARMNKEVLNTVKPPKNFIKWFSYKYISRDVIFEWCLNFSWFLLHWTVFNF